MDGFGNLFRFRFLDYPFLLAKKDCTRRAIPIWDPVYVVRGIQMDWAVTRRPGPVVGARLQGAPPVPAVAPDGASLPDVEFVPARPPQEIAPSFSCATEARLRSPTPETQIPTSIEFRNEGTSPRGAGLARHGWQAKFPRRSSVGESRAFKTYRGHVWVVAGRTGACIGIFLARAIPAWTVLR